jgi:hypothetical protein
MAIAIDLNSKLQSRTVKIQDVFIDAVLTTKFVSEQLLGSDLVPQQHLGIRHVVAELLAFQFNVSAVENFCHA